MHTFVLNNEENPIALNKKLLYENVSEILKPAPLASTTKQQSNRSNFLQFRILIWRLTETFDL